MAEWTGRKRTLNSIIPVGEPPLDAASDHLPPSPPAPGATSSPQLAGMTPDQPDLSGRARGTLPPLVSNRRPLTEYGTAQRLLGLFTPKPGGELEPSDWEQGPAATEELRRTDPALLTPLRPLQGYGLGVGRSTTAIASEALEAIGETAEATLSAPVTSGETSAATAESLANPEGPANAAVADIPGGAIRGDGATSCSAGFPVKGNARSKIYYTPESRVYEQTIAEFCFSTSEAAEAAGYRPPENL